MSFTLIAKPNPPTLRQGMTPFIAFMASRLALALRCRLEVPAVPFDICYHLLLLGFLLSPLYLPISLLLLVVRQYEGGVGGRLQPW